MTSPSRDAFSRLAEHGNVILMQRRLMSDRLTPVLAYRRFVEPDERTAPSFLLESVENGTTVGRYSILGARPSLEVIANGHQVTIIDHVHDQRTTEEHANPLQVPRQLTASWRVVGPEMEHRGSGFQGGWVGYAGYDTIRYLEPGKMPFAQAPPEDEPLADLHFGLYPDVAVFDHVAKLITIYSHVKLDEHASVAEAYQAGCNRLDQLTATIQGPGRDIASGMIELDPSVVPAHPLEGNFTPQGFQEAVGQAQEYIGAGDIFQVVLSQRMMRHSVADPFDVYRALRIVNPSPYMIYLQSADSILVASSPEILCRVQDGLVTSRPLAGTRPRGRDQENDQALEQELLGHPKERAEHVMLVDLARNDLGRVCRIGSIQLPHLLEVERYSHVMHLSSTVTGRLSEGVDCWDALHHSLPVGTVSGAPKIRAMQIIDELEPTRRGPYAGGIGVIDLRGNLDVALALRTMVIPTRHANDNRWPIRLQAGAGIVADSDPAAEYQETLNKAAALGRAIDLAESVFG